jgi:D-tyrosyl-tRNA(Tyr) deacylase
MRAVIQRVQSGNVSIAGNVVGAIEKGLVILLGIEDADGENDVHWLASKIAALRIFADESGKMNLSVRDVDGGALVISQFTLHASTKKGTRPSFIRAAAPEHAIPLYQAFLIALEKEMNKPIERGQFGADMQVSLINDGPVTLWIDTQNKS